MRKVDCQGCGRLNIVIYNNGSTAMMGTGVMLKRENFVSDRVVGMPLANQLNQMLRLKMAKVQLAIEEMGLRCDVNGMKASEIKREVMLMVMGQGGGMILWMGVHRVVRQGMDGRFGMDLLNGL